MPPKAGGVPQAGIPDDYSCKTVPPANPEQVGDCGAVMAALDKCFDNNGRQWSKCQKGHPRLSQLSLQLKNDSESPVVQ